MASKDVKICYITSHQNDVNVTHLEILSYYCFLIIEAAKLLLCGNIFPSHCHLYLALE